MIKVSDRRKLANKIARHLFTPGSGKSAKPCAYLMLTNRAGEYSNHVDDHGSWSEGAVSDVIEMYLTNKRWKKGGASLAARSLKEVKRAIKLKARK